MIFTNVSSAQINLTMKNENKTDKQKIKSHYIPLRDRKLIEKKRKKEEERIIQITFLLFCIFLISYFAIPFNKLFQFNNPKICSDITCLKRYFPLAVGNKYTYERIITKGKRPLVSYVQKLRYNDIVIRTGIGRGRTGIEEFEIIASTMNKDAFIVDGEGIEPLSVEKVDKIFWAIRELGDGGIIVHEGRESSTTSATSALAYLLDDPNDSISQQGGERKYYNDIIEKMRVNGVDYKHIMKCTLKYLGGPDLEKIQIDRYFARDIGLIKEIQFNSDGEVIYTLELKSYSKA